MLSRGKIYRCLLCLGFCLSVSVAAGAQEQEHDHQLKSLMEKGDSLRIAYRFDESLDAYEAALELTEDESYAQKDSLLKLDIQDKILMSENGRSMMNFVDIPNVVAKRKFSIDDFFLYYPNGKYLSLAFHALNKERLYRGFMTLFSCYSGK